ncbi:uncharacterized protein [Henckelia pumila]|uniref:uncharacterized protein n=1 Tax=Henckelia pumila TaxID=405737 RepID=UPI003C6E93F4
MAAKANLSLRQLGTPDLNQQPLCITFPTLEANATFELKFGLIHLLPAFHGLAGLLPHDWSILDVASGGVFVDKTPAHARNLIESMDANSQQFGTNKSDHAPRRGNEINVSFLEQQLIDLTSFVHQMAVGNVQTVKGCDICNAMGHATDMCPTLQEDSVEHVNATDGFPGPPQRKYDPYSNTYSPGWKDHPNLRYGNPQANQPEPQAPPNNQSYRPPYPQQQQRPQETRAIIQQLNTQIGQLATAVNRLEALNSNNLPSQTVVNPKENVSEITLRSEKELKVNEEVVKEPVHNNNEKESKVEEDKTIQEEPRALKESRKDERIKGLYEVFCRYEVNIPLLDAIKQVPKRAKQRKKRPKITAKLRKWVKKPNAATSIVKVSI